MNVIGLRCLQLAAEGVSKAVSEPFRIGSQSALRHQWMVHKGGWQIARSTDGEVSVIPPVIEFGATARAPSIARFN